MNQEDFRRFCSQVEPALPVGITTGSSVIYFDNNTGKRFTIEESKVVAALEVFRAKGPDIREFLINEGAEASSPYSYEEKRYRAVWRRFFSEEEHDVIRTLGGSQTKPLLAAMSKYVGFRIGDQRCRSSDPLLLDSHTLDRFFGALEEHDHVAGSEIREAFDQVCTFCEWYDSRAEPVTQSSDDDGRLRDPLTTISTWLSQELSEYRGEKITVKLGMGYGMISRVPYIALLPTGQSISDGVYAAITFGREGAGAVAGCGMSTSAPRVGFPAVRRDPAVRRVNAAGASPRTDYNNSYANPVEFMRGATEPSSLLVHLRNSLDIALDFLAGPRVPAGDTAIADALPGLLSRFDNAISESRLFDSQGIGRALLLSLMAKRFAILTGNSGSGKTKIAISLAQWLSPSQGSQSYAVVPVGADWTDNRKVIGYVNQLSTLSNDAENGIQFESTQILELLLEARKDPQRPFFLILDEMNLSHVERYFADFLSAMESGEDIPLHEYSDSVVTSSGRPVPQSIAVPANFFVIGTVNVDETTHMFSPKVLDRANVIEFRPSTADIQTFLQAGESTLLPMAGSTEGDSDLFIRISSGIEAGRLSEWFSALSLGTTDMADTVMTELHALLRSNGLEFGFRAAHEMRNYTRLALIAAGDGRTEQDSLSAIDRQILQKILPKLHGSRRRLEPVLLQLFQYCVEGRSSAHATAARHAPESPVEIESAAFPLSAAKLKEMLVTVRREQFVSFVQ